MLQINDTLNKCGSKALKYLSLAGGFTPPATFMSKNSFGISVNKLLLECPAQKKRPTAK